jgi:hypothetical protein
MIMMADALGASGGDPEDAVSVGDNERPCGADYAAPQENGYDNNDGYDYGSEEDLAFGKPDVPEESPGYDPDGREQSQGRPPESEMPTEPESMVVTTSASGAQSLFVKDPATGKWIDSETGSELDVSKYQDQLKQFEKDKKWSDAEFEKSSRGETEHDRILRENMRKIGEKQEKDEYLAALEKRYGTSKKGQMKTIIGEDMERNQEWANTWRTNDKILGVGEFGLTVIGSGADVAIDGLATVTPGGVAIRSIYKVAKGVGGTMMDPDKGFNTGSLAEGLIKGGSDAALDYIPGSGLKTVAGKAITTVVGETAGSAAGAALRGEDVGKAAYGGLIDGTSKAAVGAISDKLAGDLPAISAPKKPLTDSIRSIPTMKNVIVSKAGGTKIATAVIDEYGVKPIITDPVKDALVKK